MVKEKDWNWRKELGIDDTSDTPKKTIKTKKKSSKKKVEKEDWNWRKDLAINGDVLTANIEQNKRKYIPIDILYTI